MWRVRGTGRESATAGREGAAAVRPTVAPGAALLAVVAVFAAAPAADARSVRDPDIGWPTALRKELRLPKLRATPCRGPMTRARVRRQARIARGNLPLRGILRYGPADVWGSAWSTACDGGRMQVGIASGAPANATRSAVRRLRHRLRVKGLTDDVRLVAVRSTYKQLSQQVDAFDAAVPGFFAGDHGGVGIDTARNAVSVEVGASTPPDLRARLRAYRAASPVNVLLEIEPQPDPDAPLGTYGASFVLDRGAIRRGGRELALTIDDPSCAADETNDSAERFAGVQVNRGRHAWVLRARFRVNPDWPRVSTCEGNVDPRTTVRTTVTLPAPLGRRGIVDGADGPGGFRQVLVEPVGAAAIRSLVPRYIYSGDTCDRPAVRRAFRGRPKSGWCFY